MSVTKIIAMMPCWLHCMTKQMMKYTTSYLLMFGENIDKIRLVLVVCNVRGDSVVVKCLDY